jgi:hypothetical protein
MRFSLPPAPAIAAAALTVGCVTTALAPGAAQVRIVRNAADVSACTVVGNVTPNQKMPEDLRNLTVGLGGNTLFVTTESLGGIANGIAYRCP